MTHYDDRNCGVGVRSGRCGRGVRGSLRALLCFYFTKSASSGMIGSSQLGLVWSKNGQVVF